MAPVPERLLLDAAADFIDHRRAELHGIKGIQDGDGLGQFVADRVGVAAERIQRRGLIPAVNSSPLSFRQSA